MKPSSNHWHDAHALKCELAGEVLRSSGQLRLKVTGWSMLPSIRPGDTLFVKKMNGDAVLKGDIVLFGRDRRLFAHRVVKNMSESQILTRGDANPGPDPLVKQQELLGKVSYIVRDGKLIAARRRRSISERAVAGLVRRSSVAARIVAGVLRPQ